MQITIGSVLKVSVRNAYIRRGVFYYQRAVPKDLADRYPAKLLKLNLGTGDPIQAARKVAELNRKHEAEWALLRADPATSSKAARLQAGALLAAHGVDPKAPEQDEVALGHFLDRLDAKRIAHAGDDEDRYHEADDRDFLCPVEAAAVEMLKGPGKERLSDALALYLEAHRKGASETLRKSSTIAMDGLIAAVGDKPVEGLTRADGRAYVKAELARDVKTTTVRRRLKALIAILNAYYLERGLERLNPLKSVPIPGEGEDAEEREPFTVGNLAALAAQCRAADDEPRWLLAMLADTGARLSEVAGLRLEDIALGSPVPHIAIVPLPTRPLKTKQSKRGVPLAGLALWAARRVVETAVHGQFFAFPRYASAAGTSTNTASATLAKWLRARGMDHTAYDLRHTMRDRLRDVQCPRDIAHGIGGWDFKALGLQESKGDGYGKGYSLEIKREWLLKVV